MGKIKFLFFLNFLPTFQYACNGKYKSSDYPKKNYCVSLNQKLLGCSYGEALSFKSITICENEEKTQIS